MKTYHALLEDIKSLKSEARSPIIEAYLAEGRAASARECNDNGIAGAYGGLCADFSHLINYYVILLDRYDELQESYDELKGRYEGLQNNA